MKPLFFTRKMKSIKRTFQIPFVSTLSKRQLFVFSTIICTVGLLFTQLVPNDLRYGFTFILSCVAFALSAYALRDDLQGIEWITLLTLPTFFTASICLFYFLLPARWLTRLPVAFLYALGMYALLLTENIYNVAANRTIGLLRAAHSVGFLLTLLTYFLLTQAVLAFRGYPWLNAIIIGALTFPLIFQALWSIELEERANVRVWHLSMVATLIITELALILSFCPVKSTILALFLSSVFYSLSGLAQQYLSEKLYKKTAIEFLVVTGIVLILVLVTTRWRGNM